MIKIDIVSGFLGAGKTTFIKKMLKHYSENNEKVVLIENEFGEIGIDGELVKNDGFEVYEISKGCICCSLKNDFLYTLSEIVNKIQPDRIIFEPSGIFIPDEILQLLKTPEFSSKCTVNSLITIVDSRSYLKQNMKYSFFFQKQIACSSVIVLSKTQLVSKETVDKIVEELAHMNMNAEIYHKSWMDMSFEEIGIAKESGSSFNMDEILEQLEAQPDGEDMNEKADSSEQHIIRTHGGLNFESYGIKVQSRFSELELKAVLESIKDLQYGEVIRAKGFINSQGGCMEFSYVDGHYNIEETSCETKGKVCFIGQSLNRELLKKAFKVHSVSLKRFPRS